VAAVLGGLANKQIVATINHLGGGRRHHGVDGRLIQGRIANPEWDLSRTVKVDTSVLDALLKAGFIPVISPITDLIRPPADAPLMLI